MCMMTTSKCAQIALVKYVCGMYLVILAENMLLFKMFTMEQCRGNEMIVGNHAYKCIRKCRNRYPKNSINRSTTSLQTSLQRVHKQLYNKSTNKSTTGLQTSLRQVYNHVFKQVRSVPAVRTCDGNVCSCMHIRERFSQKQGTEQ